MTLKAGGSSQACAACKYQRKRCTPECALAPHFRPDQTDIFKNAHKLFGVRNILRILEQVDPGQKNEAMKSIIYQANMRDRSPVHGCLGVIYQLQYQIRVAEKELYSAVSQLEFYKTRQQHGQHEITLSQNDSPESGINPEIAFFQNESVNRNHNQQLFLSYNGNENGINEENVNMGINGVWDQKTYSDENNDKSRLVVTQPTIIQEEVAHDYDEIYPFFDTFDDTQSYIDSKEANESSSESSLKETTQTIIQHVVGNNLKNAELQLGIMSEDYHTFA